MFFFPYFFFFFCGFCPFGPTRAFAMYEAADVFSYRLAVPKGNDCASTEKTGYAFFFENIFSKRKKTCPPARTKKNEIVTHSQE